MNPALLLFDIDGTLLHTGGAGGKAMRLAAARLFGEQFSFDGINFNGMLDPDIFAQAAQQSGLNNHHQHHEAFRRVYFDQLKTMLERDAAQVRAMPGIPPLLQTLRQRAHEAGDLVLGLLTGNYAHTAPLKLEAARIDPAWFSVTAFGDEGSTRADLVALAMRKYEARVGRSPDPSRVIVIGDTPRDVACAKAHQCVAFAVATGSYSVAELTAAGADVSVPSLADPQPLVRLL